MFKEQAPVRMTMLASLTTLTSLGMPSSYGHAVIARPILRSELCTFVTAFSLPLWPLFSASPLQFPLNSELELHVQLYILVFFVGMFVSCGLCILSAPQCRS